jgi:hypothetical protein
MIKDKPSVAKIGKSSPQKLTYGVTHKINYKSKLSNTHHVDQIRKQKKKIQQHMQSIFTPTPVSRPNRLISESENVNTNKNKKNTIGGNPRPQYNRKRHVK